MDSFSVSLRKMSINNFLNCDEGNTLEEVDERLAAETYFYILVVVQARNGRRRKPSIYRNM